jgi:lysophospholipase L1-like esterase
LALDRHAEALAEIEAWYTPEELKQRSWLRFYYRDRCHLNPLGAEILADRLAQQLAATLSASPHP